MPGVASTFPAASLARTRNACHPFTNFLYVFGERQAVQGARSSLHWNVDPASVEAKRNVAVLLLVVRAGPDVIRVFGGTVSGGGGGRRGCQLTTVLPLILCTTRVFSLPSSLIV